MKKGYKEKTTFLIYYNLFKYLIIFFNLYNASNIF